MALIERVAGAAPVMLLGMAAALLTDVAAATGDGAAGIGVAPATGAAGVSVAAAAVAAASE